MAFPDNPKRRERYEPVEWPVPVKLPERAPERPERAPNKPERAPEREPVKQEAK